MPSDLSNEQVDTARRVFYAGAFVMFQKVVMECDASMDPTVHVAKIDSLFNEMKNFQTATLEAYRARHGQKAEA